MQKNFILSPEVAGQLGEGSIVDNSSTPPVINKLHYQFDGWLGDDILESYPCFICTERLALKMKENELKGYVLDTCIISKSDMFIEIYPNKELPFFYWLKITGDECDDFRTSPDGSLIVTEKALNVLKQVDIYHCDIEELG